MKSAKPERVSEDIMGREPDTSLTELIVYSRTREKKHEKREQ